MAENLNMLRARLREVELLGSTRAVLEWDQQTYMPVGGVTRRAEQIGLLSRMVHEQFTSAATGDLLVRAEAEVAGLDPESDEARLVANVRRDYDREVKIPTPLAEELSRHSAVAEIEWREAKARKDFHRFSPTLERTVDLTRQVAAHLGYTDDPYDPLLDMFEPGATTRQVSALFEEIKPELVDLTRHIAESPKSRTDQNLTGSFPIPAQRAMTLEVVKALGYDVQRGRQDEAPHPFCTSFTRDDVRITTRYSEERLEVGLYASLHECGHALYEQGFDAEYDGTPLAGGASSGIHESQSRLFENLVGRSREFCEWVLPKVQMAFPDSARGWTADQFYRGVNVVRPSLVRVEADEVTYNLHIFLRFELERDLLSGKLHVSQLPDAWNEKMNQYLGLTPPDVGVGVLQDVHWPSGLFGYFPTYTLGNVFASQIWSAARRDLPDLDAEIRRGEFAALRDWLCESIHRHGRKYLPHELLRIATGEPPTARHYGDYLRTKFSELYDL